MPLDLNDLDKLDRVVRIAVRDTLADTLDLPAAAPLARKWEGGKPVLWPHDEGLAAKELPLESFFHKIVMIRDRLRTLEQRINSHARLTDLEKVDLQQYVTRCYGSLTTFNVLFREKSDQFTGASGE